MKELCGSILFMFCMSVSLYCLYSYKIKYKLFCMFIVLAYFCLLFGFGK
jgi:hypothetical protein